MEREKGLKRSISVGEYNEIWINYLSFDLLYYTILILYYAIVILYYTILHYAILYCT